MQVIGDEEGCMKRERESEGFHWQLMGKADSRYVAY